MPKSCMTCACPIRKGQRRDTFKGIPYHEDPSDCVTATAIACAKIAKRIGDAEAMGAYRTYRAIVANYGLKGVR